MRFPSRQALADAQRRIGTAEEKLMGGDPQSENELKDGQHCRVIAGTHAGKSGTVRDIHTSKTGHITITVEQPGGVRFKTLAKNVVVR